MSSVPSLPEIQQWSPKDMDALSGHFNELADRRGDTMDAIQSSANNLNWTGAGNDGKTLAIAGHAATAQTHAQILRATAEIAKAGGQALYGQQQGILNTVQSAEASGFEVGDDFSVTDPNDPMGFRQGIAAAIEADLATQVGAFTSQQMATAGGIMSSTAGLGAFQTENVGGIAPSVGSATGVIQSMPSLSSASAGGGRNGVSMVDNHFKTDDPPPLLPGQAPPGPVPVHAANPPASGSTTWAPLRDPGPQPPPQPVITGRTPDGSPIARMPPRPQTEIPVTSRGPGMPPDPSPPKVGTPKDWATDVGKVAGGGVAVIGGGASVFGGIVGLPETFGGSSVAIGGGLTALTEGSAQVIAGIDDMEHLK